ncbi:hypothetical protein SETIT_5G300100v2 [Setaria italica]|uniref:Uncharacterized protein n=1 Tax=Setaria italica TaxID=4555 RepID=A0A368RA90_SETIT|nr:hypothetical protein SETIT_5G300100v2 [Setaria italica]
MVETALALWNKFVWPFLHFSGSCPGAGDGLLRSEVSGYGVLASSGRLRLGASTRYGWGAGGSIQGPVAGGFEVMRWMDPWMDLCLAARRRWVQVHGQGSMGCVPGRFSLHGSFLLRLESKPLCDGASSGFCVLAVLFLLRWWPRRRRRWARDSALGKHIRF